MRRESRLGISSGYLVPLKWPDAHGETASKREKAEMLIRKDEGHVSVVSFVRQDLVHKSWDGVGWITGRILGTPALVLSPVCLSVYLWAFRSLAGRPLFVFLRRLSLSKSPSAESVIGSDNWKLLYLKAATLY